jgi:hypothetical protein
MFQRDTAEAKRRAEVKARFLAEFPPETHSLFDEDNEDDEAGMRTFVAQSDDERPIKTLSPRAQKLAAFFSDRLELGRAVTRALGSLSQGEGWDGSWSSSNSREQLALEWGRALTGEEFLAVVENGDEVSLVGAARLFFFEDMSEPILAEKRGPLAARLAEVTLRSDRPRNADMAVRGLSRFPCEETTDLLERLAAGAVPYHAKDRKNKDEPSPRIAACIFLAQTDSPKLVGNLEELERSPDLDPFDKAALRIVRAFRGEKGLLDAAIFEMDSYTIGFWALRALEREGGKAAIDAVIYGGTKHHWGAVREEAVLTAERMTGQKWFKDDPKDRADFHDKEVRKWWTENRAALPD